MFRMFVCSDSVRLAICSLQMVLAVTPLIKRPTVFETPIMPSNNKLFPKFALPGENKPIQVSLKQVLALGS